MVEMSLELTLWFIISFAVGITIFLFVINVDYDNVYTSIKSFFNEDDDNNDLPTEGKSINQTIEISLQVWKDCGFGEVSLNRTVYINQTGNLNKSIYFEKIKDWNLCNLIKSNQYNCGNIEELEIGNITTPKIIQISCDPISNKLIIR